VVEKALDKQLEHRVRATEIAKRAEDRLYNFRLAAAKPNIRTNKALGRQSAAAKTSVNVKVAEAIAAIADEGR
jgi:hypothetical protein